LGEEVDRASLAAARKVFVDGFLSARRAYEVEVPQVPLSELYGKRLEEWLMRQGVAVHLGTPVERITGNRSQVTAVVASDGERCTVDAVVVALPWRRIRDVFADELLAALPSLAGVGEIEPAPITGVHLWFDREIMSLPHAVLVGRLSQWVFNRGVAQAPRSTPPAEHYYQIVISASRMLATRQRDDVLRQVVAELADVWPATSAARLLRWRIISEQAAVFSVRPGVEHLRPPQATPICNLALAGDWTRTGWPSTMEGAVRSGYLAAECVMRSLGRETKLLVHDLPWGWLAKWLIGNPLRNSRFSNLPRTG
jgi:squalene-associated FAD-dependent desaturase